MSLPDFGALRAPIVEWFGEHARVLPWRESGASAWGVLVSEFMLQQTPVVRVLPVWQEWMRRWPTPADLANEPRGEAVRAWGRLGYPRRALRLHASAEAIVRDFGGEVPRESEQLLALPGVGSYTAAAVASFAFGAREVVVDTNIRRVQARLVTGVAQPGQSLTRAETELAERMLPAEAGFELDSAARWNIAVMELGALVCTARKPNCVQCPVVAECAWVDAGRPAPAISRRTQAWHGTDRQVRGAVMAVLRAGDGGVERNRLGAEPLVVDMVYEPLAKLYSLGAPADQLERAVASLLSDGLAELREDMLHLPE